MLEIESEADSWIMSHGANSVLHLIFKSDLLVSINIKKTICKIYLPDLRTVARGKTLLWNFGGCKLCYGKMQV